jgi:prepilin-type N-terminal cleavage/methylation domain-containing protein
MFAPMKSTMKQLQTHRRQAFTLVEIMIVVAIIALLSAIVIPNLLRAGTRSQATACINNLRQIDTAIQIFAVEAGKHVGDTVNWPDDLTPYIKLNRSGSIPPCPLNGIYELDIIGNSPPVTCTLSTMNPPHAL